MREQKQRDKEEEKRRQESAELRLTDIILHSKDNIIFSCFFSRNYTALMQTDKMRSNKVLVYR
jgi:hypothetical protein